MAAAIGIIGSVVQFVGQRKQAKAAKKAEALRERQMNLEAARKKRELIREGVVARGKAKANAEAQGAGAGSGLAGGLAQITGQQGRNVQANNQDQQIGQGIFAANRQYAAGGTLASIGSGISSFGSAFSSFKFG
jgi:hypothetical protein